MKSFGICACGKTWRFKLDDHKVEAFAGKGGHVVVTCDRCQSVVFNSLTDTWIPDGQHHLLPVMN